MLEMIHHPEENGKLQVINLLSALCSKFSKRKFPNWSVMERIVSFFNYWVKTRFQVGMVLKENARKTFLSAINDTVDSSLDTFLYLWSYKFNFPWGKWKYWNALGRKLNVRTQNEKVLTLGKPGEYPLKMVELLLFTL